MSTPSKKKPAGKSKQKKPDPKRSAAAKLGAERRRQRLAAEFARRSRAAKLGHRRRRAKIRKRREAAKGTFRRTRSKDAARNLGYQGKRKFTVSGAKHKEYRIGPKQGKDKGKIVERAARIEQKTGKRSLVYAVVSGRDKDGNIIHRSTPVRLNEPGVGDLIAADVAAVKRKYSIERADEEIDLSVLLEQDFDNDQGGYGDGSEDE